LEPKIIAFTCNWCSYAGADLAGVSRLQYPPNVLIIRVMCTGSISPHYILKAFQKGASGVLIAGCHIGECHYIKGNILAMKRVEMMKELLGFLGYSENSLRLEWISASEGVKFADVIKDFTEKIKLSINEK